MRMLIPVILLLLGIGGGVGAAKFLLPPPEEAAMADIAAAPCGDVPAADHAPSTAETGHDAPAGDAAAREYARMNNQFVVPVVENGRVAAMVVLSISVEVAAGTTDKVFAAEPKLRDVFLQTLFDHANNGGFEGAFTNATNMRNLRAALRVVARDIVGPDVSDVLIIDILRQDV